MILAGGSLVLRGFIDFLLYAHNEFRELFFNFDGRTWFILSIVFFDGIQTISFYLWFDHFDSGLEATG